MALEYHHRLQSANTISWQPNLLSNQIVRRLPKTLPASEGFYTLLTNPCTDAYTPRTLVNIVSLRVQRVYFCILIETFCSLQTPYSSPILSAFPKNYQPVSFSFSTPLRSKPFLYSRNQYQVLAISDLEQNASLHNCKMNPTITLAWIFAAVGHPRRQQFQHSCTDAAPLCLQKAFGGLKHFAQSSKCPFWAFGLIFESRAMGFPLRSSLTCEGYVRPGDSLPCNILVLSATV